MQVPPGFEPGMRVLQTLVLPLGYDTLPSEIDEQQKILYNCQKFLSIGILYFYRCKNYRKKVLWSATKRRDSDTISMKGFFRAAFSGWNVTMRRGTSSGGRDRV